MESRYIKTYKLITAVASVVLILLIFSAWTREGILAEWKKHQKNYARIDTISAEKFPIAIRQLELPDLGRNDRCISCHNGMENPAALSFDQPNTSHPGTFLDHHPPARFGCTVCHGGQGRALDKLQAHARDESVHWPFSLMEQPYIQSSCGKCHLTLFIDGIEMPGTDVFWEGQVIFNHEGCLGCHKARGLGGTVGPDLTRQGEKTKHEYSFQNIRGEQTVSNWLKEHFQDPEMVSPGSRMLVMNLPEEELEALVTFTMGLAKPEIPFEYFSIEMLRELKGGREMLEGYQLFPFLCSACHGKQGEGKDFHEYETGVPAVGKKGLMQIASQQFLKFTLFNGRGERQMASWHPEYSGLFHGEIDSLVVHLRSKREVNNSWEEVRLISGSVSEGMEWYTGNCQMCHGENGKNGIVIPLNNPGFLEIATDRFIYETVLSGRGNTAMPSWSYLTDEQIADLLTLIRSWGARQPVNRFPGFGGNDKQEGALQYHFLCSRCHGEFGEGETGPAILNKDFLKAAGNDYLYQTIAHGRSHSAMFGWKGQTAGETRIDDSQIIDILFYMRSTEKLEWDYIYAGANPGDAGAGQQLFGKYCADCHGVNGEGIWAPAINNQDFLSTASNGFILATISLGREGTEMPSWGRGEESYQALSAKERLDLASYIRSWQKIKIKF